ncbi:hypothetical protein GCM10023226_38560 [Nocardioides nanhaiensis]|uniref:Fibronectin type-III domain-containing protein n=1 Tax=Nocardioides nanhaiensis TaxID=1476871 RepID=A0ABP8WVV3_9ACTN
MLDKPMRGRAAVAELGDQLAVAAARNDLRPAELRTLLRTDSAVWVDRQGAIFYVDPGHADHEGHAATGATGARTPQAAAAPLAETFQLHSNPTASLTILLDFDGSYVGGTAWNSQTGVTPGTHPAWDPAGNGATFSDSEKQLVQEVWAMVAEDYAPFDVDVTTEDTGPAAIERSDSGDTVYGTRVLVTPSEDPFAKICNRECGGVAYLSVFDQVGSGFQPAWVFPQALGDDSKNIAEAASHEAGHNLGLDHDGTATTGYYTGHGIWAPIMGVGYDRPLVQWSAGSYSGANNPQDDLGILSGYLGARPDEATGSVATPASLPLGDAVIGTPGDVDTFVLGACAANAVVQVQPSALAPNLDVRATLVDADGVERASAAPVSGPGSRATASGLGASLTVPSGDGWVLTVEGVGQGSWSGGGYDDYGSLGAYTVSAPGCDGALAEGVPGEPDQVVGSAAGTDSLTLTWAPPASQGDGPVTGYIVSRSGSATTERVGADARSHTFTGLTPGTTYELSVRAVNATGSGRTTSVTVRTADPVPEAPSAPQDLLGQYNASTGEIEVYWTEPATTGTAPILGYDIYFDGGYVTRMPATSRGVALSMTGGFAEGEYVVGVAAASSAGVSPVSTVPVTVALPDQPANDDVADAALLSGPSGSTPGDNTYATREATDPAPPTSYTAGGYSVWFSWTPEQDGRVDMRTFGGAADRDTTLAAYTGQPGSLTQVAGADDTFGAHAGISFDAAAGTRYLVAVDGFAFPGGSGPFSLAWSQAVLQAPSAPTQVSAQPGDSQAIVSWAAAGANGSTVTGYRVTSSPGGVTRSVAGDTTTAIVGGLTNGTPYTFTVVATNAIGDSVASLPSAPVTPQPQDTAGPVVSDFDFTPKTVDITTGQKQVTVSVRLTDTTGAEAPVMIVGSDTTSQTLGFGQMTRTSGTAQDGVYQRTVTIPTTAAPGAWSVRLYPVSDTLGNDGPGFQDHPTKLTVTNTPQDTEAPVVSDFDFTPKTVDITTGQKQVTVSVRLTDATGAEAPVMIVGSDTTSQTLGFGQMTRTSGTAQDGVYLRTVTIPTTAAPGSWSVLLYPVSDTLGNDSPGFQTHPTKLTVTNTPATAPDAPARPDVSLDDRTATITWQPPADNGSPITGYTITGTNDAGTQTVDADTTQAVFTGLIRGQTYTFTVVATNAVGNSAPSPATDPVTPATPPSAPTDVSAIAGDRSAAVMWTASTSSIPLTGYTVTAAPGGATTTVAGDRTSAVLPGLVNGTAYTFTVVATNDVGDSPASTASSPVTPRAQIAPACTRAQADAANAASLVTSLTTQLKTAKKQLSTAKTQLRMAKNSGNKAKVKRATAKVKKATTKTKKLTAGLRTAQTSLTQAQTRVRQNC